MTRSIDAVQTVLDWWDEHMASAPRELGLPRRVANAILAELESAGQPSAIAHLSNFCGIPVVPTNHDHIEIDGHQFHVRVLA